MRPAQFQQEDVIKAGQHLQAEGKEVTGAGLNKVLGGGNVVRLKRVWDEYQKTQTVVEAEPVADLPLEVAQELEDASRALGERLVTLVVGLNDKATKTAERRVTEVLRTAAEQRAQEERELAEASQALDDMENTLEDLREQLAAVGDKLAASEQARQGLEVELARAHEKLAAAELAAKEAAEAATQQQAELSASLEQARRGEQMAREMQGQAAGALQAAEARHIEDAETCQRLRLEVAGKADELATVRAQLADKAEALADAGTVAQQLRQDLASRSDELATARAQLASTSTALNAATQSAAEAADKAAKAEARAQVAEGMAQALEKTIATLGSPKAKAPRKGDTDEVAKG